MFPVVDAGFQVIASAQLQPGPISEGQACAYSRLCTVSYRDQVYTVTLDQTIAENEFIVMTGVIALNDFSIVAVERVSATVYEVRAINGAGDVIDAPGRMCVTFCRMNNAQEFLTE